MIEFGRNDEIDLGRDDLKRLRCRFWLQKTEQSEHKGSDGMEGETHSGMIRPRGAEPWWGFRPGLPERGNPIFKKPVFTRLFRYRNGGCPLRELFFNDGICSSFPFETHGM